MWLGQLLRGYLLLALGNRLRPTPKQQVLNSSLPSTCTSPVVIPHLSDVPPGAWAQAFAQDDALSGIIDISIPLGKGTVDWDRCACI